MDIGFTKNRFRYFYYVCLSSFIASTNTNCCKLFVVFPFVAVWNLEFCIGIQKGSTSHCQSLETQVCCCELQRIHGCVAGSCWVIFFMWLLLPFLILISLAEQHRIQVFLPAQFLFQVFSESKICQTSTFICQFRKNKNWLKFAKDYLWKIAKILTNYYCH